MTTLVTCASGFVSQAFVRAIRDKNEPLHTLVRDQSKLSSFSNESVFVGDVLNSRDVSLAVSGVDTVVHVPPRVYPVGSEAYQLEMHRRVHVESTRNVLDQAVSHGVRQFLLVSSAHATGRSSSRILCEDTSTPPNTPYAQAKLESEDLAISYAEQGPIDLVIVRPPSIYGLGDKGLMSWMYRMALKNVWLPLQRLEARHSLVFVDNLARAGLALLDTPKESRVSPTIIIKDPSDYRPADIYAAVCRALGKTSMMFPSPVLALQALGTLGIQCKRIPKLRGLSIFRHLTTPQSYCGHRFKDVLPDFEMLSLDAAVHAAFAPIAVSN